MNTWETKFKPGDRVSTKDGIGIVDTFSIGTFINHNLCVTPQITANMKENDSGKYTVTYEISPGNRYYNEEDLTAHTD